MSNLSDAGLTSSIADTRSEWAMSAVNTAGSEQNTMSDSVRTSAQLPYDQAGGALGTAWLFSAQAGRDFNASAGYKGAGRCTPCSTT